MEKTWSKVLESKTRLFHFPLKEMLSHGDLLLLLVRRDLVTTYKQTILGPLWLIIQPLLLAVVFTVVFGMFIKIPTGELPHFIFYLSGITFWNLFSGVINRVSGTLRENQHIYSKVYFPRLIAPLSSVLSSLIRFFVQFAFLAIVIFLSGADSFINWSHLYVWPIYVFLMLIVSSGVGLFLAGLTVKYRDISMLVGFFIQLWMYTTPVIYPMEGVPAVFRRYVLYNPITVAIEGFRGGIFNGYSVTWESFTYLVFFAVASFVIGLLVFNKIERSFVDVI